MTYLIDSIMLKQLNAKTADVMNHLVNVIRIIFVNAIRDMLIKSYSKKVYIVLINKSPNH